MNKLFDKCHHCGYDLNGGDMFKVFRGMPEYAIWTDEDIDNMIHENYAPPYTFSHAIGIELDNDRIEYYICPKCEKRL